MEELNSLFRDIETIKSMIRNNNRVNVKYVHPIIENEELAKWISAFSNSDGGDIIFGVQDDGVNINVKTFPFEINTFQIKSILEGQVLLEYKKFSFNGQNLFYISIAKSNELIKFKGIPYEIGEGGGVKELLMKKVFISYTHKDSDLTNIIEARLKQQRNIIVSRDINVTQYRDSLDEFMQTIREHDYVISIVTDAYIKSLNCMYEITQLMKDTNYKEKLFFIVVRKEDEVYFEKENLYESFEAKIYNIYDRLDYISHWTNEKERLENRIKEYNIPISLMEHLATDMKKLESVIPSMNDFIALISDKVGRSFKEMEQNEFEEILKSLK